MNKILLIIQREYLSRVKKKIVLINNLLSAAFLYWYVCRHIFLNKKRVLKIPMRRFILLILKVILVVN